MTELCNIAIALFLIFAKETLLKEKSSAIQRTLEMQALL